ncbi:MAG: 3'-5' exonuclease [bacterium]
MNDKDIKIVLDIETTGLDYKREKIIEFAALRLENGVIVDEFQTLVNPEQEIRNSSIKIHGITQDMVADAPVLSEALPKILEFIGEYPMVGHNVIFDYSFLNQASHELYGKYLNNQRIDTQHIFREVFPDEFSHGLSSLLKRFDVEVETRHRAMADAKGLALAYPALIKMYQQKYDWQVSQFGSMNYLFERFLRIQQTVQTLQCELSDLRSVFKVYFDMGGEDIISTTGEKLTYQKKRIYEYDFDKIKDVLDELGIYEKAVKLNGNYVDRVIRGSMFDEEQKEKLSLTRTAMCETKSVSIVKPEIKPNTPAETIPE